MSGPTRRKGLCRNRKEPKSLRSRSDLTRPIQMRPKVSSRKTLSHATISRNDFLSISAYLIVYQPVVYLIVYQTRIPDSISTYRISRRIAALAKAAFQTALSNNTPPNCGPAAMIFLCAAAWTGDAHQTRRASGRLLDITVMDARGLHMAIWFGQPAKIRAIDKI